MSDPQNGLKNAESLAETFPSFAKLKDAHTDLLRLDRESTDRDAFLDQVEEFCRKAYATGTLLGLDEDRRASQSLLNYWVATLFSNDRSPEETILADFDASRTPQIEDSDCPYPGTRPFHDEDVKNFFGRRTATEYISNRLKVDRLVVLVGPSGRGKTSLLLAGILPALRFDDECAGRKRFYFPVLLPGSDPIGNLEKMIRARSSEPGEVSQNRFKSYKHDSKYLLNRISKVTDLPVVILIDQFEDIFNLSPDRKVQRAFIANLLSLVEDSSNHTVIINMRSDSFDEEIKRLPKPFQDQLEPAKWTLPPLGAAEIGDAIKKPAEKVGLIFSESTLLSLIKEILSEPIGLPLMQFGLKKLWAEREINRIPEKAFTEMGGCRAAFVNAADQLYQELKPDERETMRRILMSLVRVDNEGTVIEIPVPRKELYAGRKKEDVNLVLQRLLDEGLVRLSENPEPADVQVELTHHSLVRAWHRMATWVETKKTALRFYKYAALVIIGFGFAVLLLLAAKGFVGWRRDERQLLSLRIAQQSKNLLAQNRYDLAMLVGLHAFKITDNPTSRSNLLNVLRLSPRPYRFLSKPNYGAADLVFSPDKKQLATLDDKGNISIWDLKSDGTVERLLSSSNNAGFPLIYSADGKKLASAATKLSSEGIVPDPQSNIRLWDVASGSHTNLFVDGDYQVRAMVLAPNGSTLITGGYDGRVFRWDLTKEAPAPILITKLTGSVGAVGVDPTGKIMACGASEPIPSLWSLETWERLKPLGKAEKPKRSQAEPDQSDAVLSIAFSHDGQALSVDTINSTVVWDVATGQELWRFSSEQANTGFISTFTDAHTLTSYSGDGQVVFWNLSDGRRSQLRTTLHPALFLALAGDGTLLALPDEDGITIWNLGENRPLTVPGEFQEINSLAFDNTPNSTILAAGLNGGQVLLWDTSDRRIKGKLEPANKSAAVMLAFSPDGKTLTEVLFDGTILMWNVSSRSPLKEFRINGDLYDLVYSPDGKQLALIAGNETSSDLILRNLESGDEQEFGDLGSLTSVAFSNDGKTLFAGNRDGRLFAWDIASQKTIAEFPTGEGEIRSVRLDSTGTRLAAGTLRSLKVFEVSSLSAVEEVFHKPRIGVFDLEFSQNGEVLGILTPWKKTNWERSRGGLILLDVKTGEQLGDVIPSESEAMSFALRSDGKMLASADNALTIDLWDLQLSSPETFCSIANSNPSQDDWYTFLGRDQKYCRICGQFGPGAGAPNDAPECGYWKWWEALAKYIV